MKRLLFTILFCLSLYGLVAFTLWDINWGYENGNDTLNGFCRFFIAISTIILANVTYPLIKDK